MERRAMWARTLSNWLVTQPCIQSQPQPPRIWSTSRPSVPSKLWITEEAQQKSGVRAAYFYVEVTTGRLNKITKLFDEGTLVPHVGTVLSLANARTAHEMLGGAPHKRGKIVLQVSA